LQYIEDAVNNLHCWPVASNNWMGRNIELEGNVEERSLA
jgi:hypothetical protein